MVLVNNKLKDADELSPDDISNLTFSNNPQTVGIASNQDVTGQQFVVYANDERGSRDWKKVFSNFTDAVNYAVRIWDGMTASYALIDAQRKELHIPDDIIQSALQKEDCPLPSSLKKMIERKMDWKPDDDLNRSHETIAAIRLNQAIRGSITKTIAAKMIDPSDKMSAFHNSDNIDVAISLPAIAKKAKAYKADGFVRVADKALTVSGEIKKRDNRVRPSVKKKKKKTVED